MGFQRKVLGQDDAAAVQDSQTDFAPLPVDIYRVRIIEVLEPEDDEGGSYKVTFEVEEGIKTGVTNATRKIIEYMTSPRPDMKDGGQFCERRLAVFGIACGLFTAAEFAEGKVAELTDAEDKVILVRTKHSKRIVDGAEKTYTNVDGMHMYACDDAKAAELINKAKGAKTADDKFKAL